MGTLFSLLGHPALSELLATLSSLSVFSFNVFVSADSCNVCVSVSFSASVLLKVYSRNKELSSSPVAGLSTVSSAFLGRFQRQCG